MMRTPVLALVSALAMAHLGASTSSAQMAMHTMVTPGDLKWTDVPSLPAGAKLAIIEGPSPTSTRRTSPERNSASPRASIR
jgi:hypothetical protein